MKQPAFLMFGVLYISSANFSLQSRVLPVVVVAQAAHGEKLKFETTVVGEAFQIRCSMQLQRADCRPLLRHIKQLTIEAQNLPDNVLDIQVVFLTPLLAAICALVIVGLVAALICVVRSAALEKLQVSRDSKTSCTPNSSNLIIT